MNENIKKDLMANKGMKLAPFENEEEEEKKE